MYSIILTLLSFFAEKFDFDWCVIAQWKLRNALLAVEMWNKMIICTIKNVIHAGKSYDWPIDFTIIAQKLNSELIIQQTILIPYWALMLLSLTQLKKLNRS